MKCELIIKVMGLNEEVQSFNSRCSTMQVEQCCQKLSEVPLDRASSRVGRASRQNATRNFLLSARPSKPLLWSSDVSDTPRMVFLTLQVLGGVSLSFIHSFNVLNVT